MNVLSLFDGMACGLQALKEASVVVDNYYASEVDDHAIKIAKKNHPEIQHLGCVTEWRSWNLKQKRIDLVIGGSPCQGFSFAGKQLNFSDPRSKLFFDFVDILREIRQHRDCNFLLENVRMKQEYLDVISAMLEKRPVLINSSLVSAQNRQRYYWCDWEVEQPEDRQIFWGDVRQHRVNYGNMYYSDKAMNWIKKHGESKNKKLKVHGDNEKMQMIEASHFKKYSSQRFFGIIDFPMDRFDRVPYPKSEVFEDLAMGHAYRYITPIECERLQTLPDNYTEGVSNTQRYKMLGNGWTLEVIKHIFQSNKNLAK